MRYVGGIVQGKYGEPMSNSEFGTVVVSDIMSTPVVMAKEEASIKEVAKMMKKYEIDSVIIVNKHNEPTGIITEGDIVRRLVSAKRNLWFVRASHVMSKPVITVPHHQNIEDAAQLMAEKKVKKLCVVDRDNKVKGMITTSDITKNAAYLIGVLKEVIQTGYYNGEQARDLTR